MSKSEYEVKEVFDNNAKDIETLLKKIFVDYCIKKLEQID